MERTVESILVDCDYAEHGFTEKTAYYYHGKHRLMCPHAPCECLDPGCDFAGKRGELLDHLTAGAGHHKWPSTTFQYWVPFDLRIVEPGTHVLRCKNDGQLFLVIVQAAAEPPGLAVSLVYVEHLKPNGFQCSVSFSYSTRHRGTSTWELWPSRFSGSRPPFCVVPNKVSDGPDEAGIVLTVNIACIDAVDEDDDLDDSSYVESDDEDGDNE
jgi:E3 ubiquitin-protein ligase SIAH1